VTPTLVLVVALMPVVVAYVIACLRDPLRYALPPYAVMIPFSSLLAIGSGPFSSLSSLLGLLLGVALVAQLITSRRGSPQLLVAVPIWLAFLSLSALSLFWSIAPRATVADLLVLASQVLLFVALAVTRFDQVTLRRFGTALIVGGVLVVLYGLAQLTVLGGLPAPDGRAARFGNDLLGANNQAAALLLPIAIASARALTGPARSRLTHGAATLLMLFGVLMTGSRGGTLAPVVVLATIVLLGAARRATKVGLVAAAAVLLAVVLLVNPGGVGQRQLKEGSGSSGRTDIWAVGLYACPRYCLAGAGGGGFPTVYQQELESVPDARVQERGSTFEPHNIYLLVVIELGVLGLLLTLAGLGTALTGALRLPEAMRGPPVAALLGTMVSSFFLSNLEFKFFWAVLAYAAISVTVAAGERAAGAATLPPVVRRFAVTGQGGH
jgi:O-antigen ligase